MQAKTDSPNITSERAETSPRPILADVKFTRRTLDRGFYTALILAGVCLVASVAYLTVFMTKTMVSLTSLIAQAKENQIADKILELAVNAQLVIGRLALLSCGLFVAMAFGFLGFSLFLLGIRAEMELSAKAEDYGIKVARLSPGVFVMLCATILIGFCITRSTPFEYKRETPVEDRNLPTKDQPRGAADADEVLNLLRKKAENFDPLGKSQSSEKDQPSGSPPKP